MLLIYPFFIVISFLVPRNKRIWVFGYVRSYNENTRYFFEYSSSQGEFDCYWLANNKEEMLRVISIGYKSVLKKSLKGYWLSARANLSFICQGFSDVNRILSLKSKVINFWHGTPIKKVYADAKHDLNKFGNSDVFRYFAKKMMLLLTSRISLYYASNELERNLVCAAANIPLRKSVVKGSPRFNIIRKRPDDDKLVCLKRNYSKIILYAPTWRENGLWSKKYVISSSDYINLNNTLKSSNTLLIIKPHPITDHNELIDLNIRQSSNIKYSNELEIFDINSFYYFADVLITDVSSSMFDYLLFDKPILLFMPDIEEYLHGDRGIYDYFENILLQNAIVKWSDLISRLNQPMARIQLFGKISNEISTMVDTNKAIYDDLKKRLYNSLL